MKLVRSWPAVIPQGRSYIIDDIPKFVMGVDGKDYDYRHLIDLDDDVVLIEWDIAVDCQQLTAFMARAKAEPDQVRVAPYLLYRTRNQIPFYVHRVKSKTKHWATGPEDTHCLMFGFGLVYLPQALIVRFMAQFDPDTHFGDSEFSRWHMRHAPKRNVPIDWDCRAVHLHYRTPEVP